MVACNPKSLKRVTLGQPDELQGTTETIRNENGGRDACHFAVIYHDIVN